MKYLQESPVFGIVSAMQQVNLWRTQWKARGHGHGHFQINQNGWLGDYCAAGATASLVVAWQSIAKGCRVSKVKATPSLSALSAHTQSGIKFAESCAAVQQCASQLLCRSCKLVLLTMPTLARHLLWLLNNVVTRTPTLPCFETPKYPLNGENKRPCSAHGQPTEGDMIPHYLVFISASRGQVSPPCPKCLHPSETKLLFTARADSEHSSVLLHSSQTF